MKKNRNSFFSEANMYNQAYNPAMNMPEVPYQAQSTYNAFYAGGNPNIMPNNTNDLESRLAKIERQINRLDHRISKLEQNSSIIEDYDTNTTNMYML